MPDTHVTITGNLTDDPEVNFTPNGAAVCNFRVAVTARIKDGEGWRDGDTSFFRVNAWRQLAEHVAESLAKGSRVIVVGQLRARSWETPEGERRTVVEVVADELGPSRASLVHLGGGTCLECRRTPGAVGPSPPSLACRKAERSSRGPTVRDA